MNTHLRLLSPPSRLALHSLPRRTYRSTSCGWRSWKSTSSQSSSSPSSSWIGAHQRNSNQGGPSYTFTRGGLSADQPWVREVTSWSQQRLRFFSTTSTLSQQQQSPIKVAIVGSGPSGCYTAKYLLSYMNKLQKEYSSTTTTSNAPVEIDMIERLPTPYGLVRNGVAPDHPEVKIVQNDFDSVLFGTGNSNNNDTPEDDDDDDDDDDADADATTTTNFVNFYGNVNVGSDVSFEELRKLYDVVILAYGCESDRTLNIPGGGGGGEQPLHGVLSAREFVAWYNGHVDFDHVGDIVNQALKRNGDDEHEHIVVLGVGNVALDCARILAKTRSALEETDISSKALDILHANDSKQRQRTISIVGRRGHVQGAFTIKELRELTKLHDDGDGSKFIVRQDELDLGMTSATKDELSKQRPKVRIDKLLREHATSINEESIHPDESNVSLRFLLNPVRFDPDPNDSQRLGSVVCERTRLEGEANKQKAVGTGEFESIPAQLALVSIGYKGVSIPGTEEWFDAARGVMKNDRGRIQHSQPEDGLGGVYVSGWLKRGPTGIIGTNIPDAKDTVATIVKDLQEHSPSASAEPTLTSLAEILRQRNVPVVDWDGVQRIEAVESSSDRKRSPMQPREKLTTREELLKAAGSL